MSGYIGVQPVPKATQRREYFTATNGQTSFTTSGYTPEYIDVYMNGVKLSPADFTATNGSDVVLGSGAATGDLLQIISFLPFSVLNQAFSGTLSVAGAVTANAGDVKVRSTSGSTLELTNTSTTLGDNAFVGGLAFRNDDTSGSPPHYAGIKARTDGSGGTEMDLEFYANRDKYETDAPHMVLRSTGNLGINIADASQKLHVGGNAIITGLTRLGNGTESSPAYQFVDDTNTGMYRSSSDVLGFSTGGGNRLTLNSTGATFSGTVTADGLNVEIPDNNASPVTIQQGGNSYFKIVTTNSSESVQIGNSTTKPDVLLGEGSVGIGTSTIGDKLVVQGASSATASIVIQDPTAADYGTHLSYDDANSKAIFGGLTNGTKNPALSVARDAASGIEIDSSGNVGIGTTSPNNKLDVNGGIVCSPNTDGKDTFELSTHASDEGRLRIKNVDTTTVQIRAGGDSYFNGGKVGIGTTTPKRHIHLNGGNETTKIQITNQTTGSGSDGDGFQLGIATDGTANIEQRENADLVFSTNNSERVRIGNTAEIQIGGTTNAGFVDFDGTSLQLNTQRNPNTGAFVNTGRAHAGITLRGADADSSIKFYTKDSNNATGNLALTIDKSQNAIFTGSVGIGSTRTDRGLLNVNHNNTGDAFSGSHIALTYDVSPTNNDSKAGITYATSDSDNYGYFQGAERTTSGHGAFVLRYHNNSAGGTKVMEVNSNGAVSKFLQPAFLARPSTAQNNVTEGAGQTVVFGTEVFDQSSDFSSNTFTAPVTGKYQLNTIVYLSYLDKDADYTEISIITSNRNYHIIVDPGVLASDPVYWSFPISVLADMDASDTAYVRYNQVGGVAQTDIKVDSFFSGHLVA